jgi:hypothetical protein
MKKLLLLALMAVFSSSVFAGDIGPGALQDEDLLKFFAAINKNTLNHAYTNAGLGVAATTKNIQTTVTLSYTVDGIFYTMSPMVVTLSALTVQPVSTTSKYAVMVSSTGTLNILQGDPVTVTADAKLPALPDGYTLFGFFQVSTNGSTTFTAGTTGLTASGLTVTYSNVGAMLTGKYKMSLLKL